MFLDMRIGEHLLQGVDRTDRNGLAAQPLDPFIGGPARERLGQQRDWAREYAGPWVQRRLRGESSGDALQPKRPDLAPLSTPVPKA